MRWIWVALAACVAVATANMLEDDDNKAYDGEQQNNIDIFLPRSLNKGHTDRAVRAFYYNYWLYPPMSFKARVPYDEASPYVDYNSYNYEEPLTFQDVFEKPVVVVTPSQNALNTFSMFYLHNGLRTLHRYQAFMWLQEFFKHPGLKALIFYPNLIYSTRFFETPITSVTVQEDLRMSDFVSIERCNTGKIPYMFVAQEDVFDRMHFSNIAKVSDFKVYNDAIEVHPIIFEPRPTLKPGPQLQQTQQQLTAAENQQQVAPQQAESSVNGMNFRSEYEASFEKPQVLATPVSLVASHAERGLYGDTGYGDQYLYGMNQAVNGQYNVNGQRAANAAHVSNSYQQVTKADLGARKNIYGTLTGVTQASMPLLEARFGAHQGLLQSEGQVKSYGVGMGSGYTQPEIGAVGHQGVQIEIPRSQDGSISGQLSATESTYTGTHDVGVTIQKAQNVVRTDSDMTQSQNTGVTSASTVEVSGQQQSAVDGVSRAESGSLSVGKSAIVYPKEVELEGSAGAPQGNLASGVQVESVSRSGVSHSTEQVSGHYEVHSSGGAVQGENLAKTGSVTFETQADTQGGIASGLNTGISSTSGEHVTESQTVTFSSTTPGQLIRTEGNFGGSIGLQGGIGGNMGVGGLGGKVGFSGNLGSGLLRLGTGIDATTHGLESELLRHHQEHSEHSEQPSGISSSSSVTKSVVSTYGPTQSSVHVEGESVEISKPVVSAARTLVSSARSLNEENFATAGPVILIEQP